MQRTGLLVCAAAAIITVNAAQADTIFDVEHARANARAGLVSESDAEFLDRWGALSGTYPPRLSERYYGRSSIDRKRRWRRTR